MACLPPWQPWILLTFWTAQTATLLVPALEILLTLVLLVLKQSRLQFTFLDIFSTLISFALVFVEFRYFILGKLSPSFYLAAQIFKSAPATWYFIRWTFCLYPNAWCNRSFQNVLRETVNLLTFWGALIYAIYVFLRFRRMRKRFGAMNIDDQIATLSFSSRINAAEDLKASTPAILKLIRWLNADASIGHTLEPRSANLVAWVIYLAKYAVGAIPIVVLFSVSSRLPGEPVSAATKHTAPLPDEWKYPKPVVFESYKDSDTADAVQDYPALDEEAAIDAVSLHSVDGVIESRQTASRAVATKPFSTARLLTPRFLCFVTKAESQQPASKYITRRVDVGDQAVAKEDYVFISYTRRQFFTQIPNDPSLSAADRERFKAATARDKAILIDFAMDAVKEAGVAAFWVDFECIRPEEEDDDDADIEEVYRICDIVRASHSMAIVLGPTLNEDKNHIEGSERTEWLLDWGKRLWTVPEALLCPSEHRISVYSAGSSTPEKLAKRNLPARVWDDAGMLRQLIDHYEASLHLTQLELISIALECLQRRQTEKRNAGDVAYALMGLLRLRPKVDKADTDFQAFARLSLANDSDKLLERLICLASRTRGAPWHDMADIWDTKLWQIDPQCQVAGLGSNNTIVIGTASGTSIDWTFLYPVDFTQKGAQRRARWLAMRGLTGTAFSLIFLYFLAQFVMIPIVLDFSHQPRDRELPRNISLQLQALAGLFLGIIPCTLPIPAWLSQHVRRDLASTQARLFGIKGRPSLAQVEEHLFGAACGRLKWSTTGAAGSRLSEGDSRQTYTLIDTMSLTATTFVAEKPPTMLFVGGSERGMLRAILCWYDYGTRAFVKEAVVRLESAVGQRMQRLDRFSFSIAPAPPKPRTQEIQRFSAESDRILIPDIPEYRDLED